MRLLARVFRIDISVCSRCSGPIGLTVHPHPTLGEAVMEAAKHAIGEAIHLQNPKRS